MHLPPCAGECNLLGIRMTMKTQQPNLLRDWGDAKAGKQTNRMAKDSTEGKEGSLFTSVGVQNGHNDLSCGSTLL